MLPPMLDDPRQHITPAACHKRQKSRGQSLVEFAVLLPILVMILAIAADFGRAFTAYIAISSAAREGAAYGMQSSDQASDTAMIRAAALADAPTIWGTEPTVPDAVITEDAQGYDMVSVTVNYSFSTFLPLPSVTSPVLLTRTVSMRVIN